MLWFNASVSCWRVAAAAFTQPVRAASERFDRSTAAVADSLNKPHAPSSTRSRAGCIPECCGRALCVVCRMGLSAMPFSRRSPPHDCQSASFVIHHAPTVATTLHSPSRISTTALCQPFALPVRALLLAQPGTAAAQRHTATRPLHFVQWLQQWLAAEQTQLGAYHSPQHSDHADPLVDSWCGLPVCPSIRPTLPATLARTLHVL